MARDLTAEELVTLRQQLLEARSPSPIQDKMGVVLDVLSVLVDAMGESADLTLLARERSDETTGRTC